MCAACSTPRLNLSSELRPAWNSIQDTFLTGSAPDTTPIRQVEFIPRVDTEVSVVGKVALGQVCLHVYFSCVYCAHYYFTKNHQTSGACITTHVRPQFKQLGLSPFLQLNRPSQVSQKQTQKEVTINRNRPKRNSPIILTLNIPGGGSSEDPRG